MYWSCIICVSRTINVLELYYLCFSYYQCTIVVLSVFLVLSMYWSFISCVSRTINVLELYYLCFSYYQCTGVVLSVFSYYQCTGVVLSVFLVLSMYWSCIRNNNRKNNKISRSLEYYDLKIYRSKKVIDTVNHKIRGINIVLLHS